MIRLTTALYRQVHDDLQRPHPFAGERVGFLFAGLGTGAGGQRLILMKRYQSVADEHYLDLAEFGAAINADAIRRARQEAMDTGDGIFHVHEHYGRGVPYFSPTDRQGYRSMVPSFIPMAPGAALGALLLNSDNATCLVWWPGQTTPVESPVRLVGFPMKMWGHREHQ